jgi:hypothetical protein
MSDTDKDQVGPDESSQGAGVERQTGGLEGQAGYNNTFADGRYGNEEIADSGGESERAGSYEEGRTNVAGNDAIKPLQPQGSRHIGSDNPDNNYVDGREVAPRNTEEE